MNTKTEENYALKDKIDQQNERMQITDSQFIVDSNIDPDVLKVMLLHVKAANEQDEDLFKSTVVNSDSGDYSMVDSMWEQGKTVKVILQKIEVVGNGETTEPRYFLSVHFNDRYNSVPLLKFDDGWRIADFD